MLKEAITWYGDNQIYVLWIVIIVLLMAILSLSMKGKKIANPKLLNFKFKQKILNGEKLMLVYSISVGAVVDNDVSERRMTVEVNGQTVETQTYSFDVVNLGEKSFNEGDKVKLTLVDVDDVGNVSEPAVVEFVAADTIPPSSPSGFGVNLVREDFDVGPSGV
jgi:hypothetical protein